MFQRHGSDQTPILLFESKLSQFIKYMLVHVSKKGDELGWRHNTTINWSIANDSGEVIGRAYKEWITGDNYWRITTHVTKNRYSRQSLYILYLTHLIHLRFVQGLPFCGTAAIHLLNMCSTVVKKTYKTHCSDILFNINIFILEYPFGCLSGKIVVCVCPNIPTLLVPMSAYAKIMTFDGMDPWSHGANFVYYIGTFIQRVQIKMIVEK